MVDGLFNIRMMTQEASKNIPALMDTEPILLRQNSDGTITNDLAEENAKAASRITVDKNGKAATKKFGSVGDLQQSVALLAVYGNGSVRLITLSELVEKGMISDQYARSITKQVFMTEVQADGETYYVPSYQADGLTGAFTKGGYGGIISDIADSKDSAIQDEEATGEERNDKSKAYVLHRNRIKGRAFEQQEFSKFCKAVDYAEEQITAITNKGTKVRFDAIGIDKRTGEIIINEYKSSATAGLTKNQRTGFPELYQDGGIVVGKGKGKFKGGTNIQKGTKVGIIRPKK